MKIRAFVRWAALCAMLSAPLVAGADDKDKDKDKTPDTTSDASNTQKKVMKLADNEIHVLSRLHHINQMEIDAGKLAERQGSTQAVKNYGQMLVKDHTQADRDIMSFAKKHGQTVPAYIAMTDTDKQDMKSSKDAMDRLKNMKGADFDREFLRQMADDHDKVLAKIDTDVGQITDTDMQTLLKDIKPVLQKHADQARDLSKNTPQAMNP